MGQRTQSPTDSGAQTEIVLHVCRDAGRARRYRIANELVALDLYTEFLRSYLVPDQIKPSTSLHQAKLAQVARDIQAQGTAGSVFTAWIGNSYRKIFSRHLAEDLLVAIDGLGKFIACPRQGLAARVGAVDEKYETHALEIALGPLLSVLLAQRGVFCLHGSSLAGVDEAICFVGESGAGKSTLAAYLGSNIQAMRRVADDVVPVRLDDLLTALPGYPQLKISAADQPGWQQEPVPVSAVVEIEQAASANAEVVLEPTSQAQACLTLARHTVSARLFGPELLARHLEFCAAASQHVRSYKLTYPHDRNNLPLTLALLRAEFGWR